MDLDSYITRKTGILRALLAALVLLLRPFLRFRLGEAEWTALLYVIYPDVERARYDAARLGREFFDAKRLEHEGETIPVFLAPYTFEEFAEALEPSRQLLQGEDSPDAAVLDLLDRVTKEVENGGRRTIIRAVREDTAEPGWARYDPRPPTCAFCTMLISRGPVYSSARAGGARVSDKKFKRKFNNAEDISTKEFRDQLMNDFHPGCTCLVIPVYDRSNWEGREQYVAARELWKDETKGYSGLDALNALRRALYSSRKGESSKRLPSAA